MEEEMLESSRLFVEEAGEFIRGSDLHLSPRTVRGRFVAHFGVSPRHCAWLWCNAKDRLCSSDGHVKRAHLPWTLNVPKTDATEHVLKGRWGADEKTVRKWLCIVPDVIGTLGLIDWNNRLCGQSHCQVHATVDGTDFRIKEPRPFSSSWHSHKFKGPGVRHEIGICTTTGWIAWIDGPHGCGSWPDLAISQAGGLHDVLGEGERHIADNGHLCEQALIGWDAITWIEHDCVALARARHETVNAQFKRFGVIGNGFHRPVEKHGLFVHAIAQIVQLGIVIDEWTPFDCQSAIGEPSFWPTWQSCDQSPRVDGRPTDSSGYSAWQRGSSLHLFSNGKRLESL